MHLSVFETTNVDIPIDELEGAVTLLFPITEMSYKFTSVDPLGFPFTFYSAFNEIASIGFLTLFKVVGALAVE